MLTFYQYLAFLLPVVFILIKGYFLSIEFSLYPYFVSSGLLPYKNIVDQHFPSVFFGFFSLPYFLVDGSHKLLILLISLNLSTTYILFVVLKRLKVELHQIWTLIFSLLLIYFSANTLWIETFVCFFLAIVFYLNTRGEVLHSIVSGVITSQIILLRPTIAIFLLGYFILVQKHKFYNLLGGLAGLALSFLYLIQKNILANFYNNAIIFNKDVYALIQYYQPVTSQIFILIVMATVFVGLSFWKKKYPHILFGLSTLATAWPRFGLEHLQVFCLVFVYFLAQLRLSKAVTYTVLVFALLVSAKPLFNTFRDRYGNYFYTPEVIDIAKKVKQIPDKNIYLYGASDLIYQMAGKLPPSGYYLPSLPWYINYKDFQDKLKQSLTSTNTVIIDPEFRVDGQKLIDTTPGLFSYIKMNYYLDSKINHLEIYKLKK